MSQRSKAVEVLAEYFDSKGEILSPTEYRRQKDTPIRPQQVKRVFGTWSRMEKIVRAFDARNKNKPEPSTDAREVIAEQNRLAAEHEALIRAIGEDVEQKTAREEAARRQIEADALNAATPEGARENKVRKGGPESVDAKTIKESVARAVATEHAMLAKTPEGAALGKELLGGVEDQDAKNLAIARQNARTERSALLAATPEGSALAKMEEDDSDGKLTREADVRLRNELRPYVAPATEETVADIVEGEIAKVRPEVKETIEKLAKDNDDLSIGAALRGDLMYEASSAPKIVTDEELLDKAPPASRVPDPAVLAKSEDEALKDAGLKRADDEETADTDEPADVKDGKLNTTPTAPENKESVNLEENKENPEAPPADRNPDPAFTAPIEDGKRTAPLKAEAETKKTPAKK
jgi:hypothetical protein